MMALQKVDSEQMHINFMCILIIANLIFVGANDVPLSDGMHVKSNVALKELNPNSLPDSPNHGMHKVLTIADKMYQVEDVTHCSNKTLWINFTVVIFGKVVSFVPIQLNCSEILSPAEQNDTMDEPVVNTHAVPSIEFQPTALSPTLETPPSTVPQHSESTNPRDKNVIDNHQMSNEKDTQEGKSGSRKFQMSNDKEIPGDKNGFQKYHTSNERIPEMSNSDKADERWYVPPNRYIPFEKGYGPTHRIEVEVSYVGNKTGGLSHGTDQYDEMLGGQLHQPSNMKTTPMDDVLYGQHSKSSIDVITNHSLESEINVNLLPDSLRAKQVWVYGSPILILCGTIGNFLSIVVMLRKKIRQTTTSLYLIVLALTDTGVLYLGLLRYWVKALQDYDVRSLSSLGCKWHIFLVYALQQFDSWVLVSLTIERLTAVFLPLKAKEIFTKQFASVGLIVIGLIVVSLNVQFFFTHDLFHSQTPGGAQVVCTSIYIRHRDHITKVWPWIDFCAFSLFPFIIMLVSNIAIIWRIIYSRYARRHHLHSTNDSAKLSSMTAMLMTVSFWFFFTTTPISVYLIGQPQWQNTADEYGYAQLQLAWAIVNLISYTNNAVNFLLYCISGPRFRHELIALFTRRNSVHPNNTVNVEMTMRTDTDN